MPVSYEGLKVGLELHCQLDTAHKLFCNCPTKLAHGEPDTTFLRRLRPTQSELGEVDPAALFEFQRGRTVHYEADKGFVCLVEADEEPPHALDEEALESSLMISLMLGAKPVDEVHVMRKVVIDGSNTTGFQRTAAIGLDGELEIGGKIIPIQHVSLEEDAARKTGELGMTVNYRIDRLGMPLVEVATAPVISSPEEAEEVAYSIGRILKVIGKVKRGLGTIRQDLNVSLPGGALIEIKGVQRLDLISKVIALEFQRQRSLIEIADELRKRGVLHSSLNQEPVDVTQIMKGTKCKIISDSLKRGGVVYALKLTGFSSLIGKELVPGVRLGTEMSWRAMYYGGVGGIFHTDELPGHGVSEKELVTVKDSLSTNELDAVVLVSDKQLKAVDALNAVVDRAKEALDGVPEETRAAKEDGTTQYMRPRPGAARMYPETDIPSISVEEDLIEKIKTNLPKKPEEIITRIMGQYSLNKKLSEQLLDSDYLPLFEKAASQTQVAPSYIAAVLTETIKSLERKGAQVSNLTDGNLLKIFSLVDTGVTAKESIEPVLEWLCENKEAEPMTAVKTLKLEIIKEDELNELINKFLNDNSDTVIQLKDKSVGRLMGIMMKELRGRVNTERLLTQLKIKVKEFLEESARALN